MNLSRVVWRMSGLFQASALESYLDPITNATKCKARSKIQTSHFLGIWQTQSWPNRRFSTFFFLISLPPAARRRARAVACGWMHSGGTWHAVEWQQCWVVGGSSHHCVQPSLPTPSQQALLPLPHLCPALGRQWHGVVGGSASSPPATRTP